MQIKRPLILYALALLFCLAACAKPSPGAEDGKIKVAVTTDALYEMAAYIGGERVSITKLIPDGVELHDFEPRAKDIASLSGADALIVNGLGLEPWIEDAVNASGNAALVMTDASKGITPVEASDGGHDDGGHGHGHAHDPHIWLSPACAVTMAENIRDALISADPGGEADYRSGCDGFTARLIALSEEYAPVFTAGGIRPLVTAHTVFAYLCRDFGLSQESASGVFDEGEPSPQRLAGLVDFCRENGVTAVFAESGHSTRVVETLAGEIGAGVVTIYTMESAEDGLSYLERMEYNLAAIAGALYR